MKISDMRSLLFFAVFAIISSTLNGQPDWTVINYTNSTTAYGIVTLCGSPAGTGDMVGAFVGSECRAKQAVTLSSGVAYVTLVIQGDFVETVNFKIWDSSSNTILNSEYSTTTSPTHSIGLPPNYLPISAGQLPAQPGSISGNITPCEGSSQSYGIAAVSGATSYTWSLPVGWSGSSTSATITAGVGITSGTVSVTANNYCGSGPASTLGVSVILLPSQPGVITGNTTPCQGTLQTYSIAPVSGATSYTWALPSGWSGSSTTSTITVTSGSSGGTISVYANNTCGSGTARTLDVSVTVTPAQPGAITGEAAPCEGSVHNYSIAPASNATFYTWSLPAGWAGSSATSTVTATVGATGGTVAVSAGNTCGSSATQTLAVSVAALPGQPGTIAGSTAPCQGASQVYSITPVSGATSYTWELPSGWSGSSTGTTITATVGATGGTVTVRAANTCGPGTPRTLGVTAPGCPGADWTVTPRVRGVPGDPTNIQHNTGERCNIVYLVIA